MSAPALKMPSVDRRGQTSRRIGRGWAARVGLSALSLVVVVAAECATPQKKVIEFGWDEPDPAFMRQHLSEMEATPFDGCVYHVNYTQPDGNPGRFTWETWGKRAFTEQELAPAIEDLKATPFRRFRHNFLRFNATPADLDWFDDFAAVVANARLAAHVAKAGGSRGIMFDVEQYQGQLFDYRQQRDAATKSWEEYAAQARRRGREVMEGFQEGYPDLVLFLTFGYTLPWRQSEHGLVPLKACSYGLLAPFLDGMVEAATGGARIIDGHELSYPDREPWRFPAAYKEVKKEVLRIVADPKKYGHVFSVSFGIWVDQDWRKYGWEVEQLQKNYLPPRTFELITRKALETTDEYVWIYAETPRWWSEESKPVKLPAAYVKGLRRARRSLTPE